VERLPGAHLAKAFNMAQARVWTDPDMSFDERALVTLFTADDPATADTVASLIRETGSDALHVGGSEHAYKLEAAAALVIQQLLSGKHSHTVLNLIRPEVRAVREGAAA